MCLHQPDDFLSGAQEYSGNIRVKIRTAASFDDGEALRHRQGVPVRSIKTKKADGRPGSETPGQYPYD